MSIMYNSCERGRADSRASSIKAKSPEAAWKYLVEIGGCNDCHNMGYMEVDGNLPESDWLTGSLVEFRGPWGTTYPPNLRIFMDETPEDEFVQIAKTRKTMPPMPWPSLNKMSEQDLRAIHR